MQVTEEKSEAFCSGGSAKVYIMMQVEGQRNQGREKKWWLCQD